MARWLFPHIHKHTVYNISADLLKLHSRWYIWSTLEHMFHWHVCHLSIILWYHKSTNKHFATLQRASMPARRVESSNVCQWLAGYPSGRIPIRSGQSTTRVGIGHGGWRVVEQGKDGTGVGSRSIDGADMRHIQTSFQGLIHLGPPDPPGSIQTCTRDTEILLAEIWVDP